MMVGQHNEMISLQIVSEFPDAPFNGQTFQLRGRVVFLGGVEMRLAYPMTRSVSPYD